jgi:hypothetical protein
MFNEWAVFALLTGVYLWVLIRFFEWRSRMFRSITRGHSVGRRSRHGQASSRNVRNDSDRLRRGSWRWITAGESRSSSRLAG